MATSERFHPLVEAWFSGRFAAPTEPQRRGWPEILARRDTLIAAPNDSVKTLAAFLACLDRLVRQAAAGALPERTPVVYVSPLKALGNDVRKNLLAPLAEMSALGVRYGVDLTGVRVAVRSGDTTAAERRKMLVHPPHILITTPESLYILLTARKSRERLAAVDTVIVDEIHAVADDKRGSHLSISLERLAALCDRPPLRIGLSATQKPIEEVARFLAGSDRSLPVIVDAGHRREMDLAVEIPGGELGAVCTHEQWKDVVDRLAEHIRAHRSTLVFVNTRRLVERVSHQLAERLGEDPVAAHHGSLSKATRLRAEERLKSGELRAVVATASLELGIDVGTVDLVCQVGSPRSIAVALQRVGRSGHALGALPKGRLFALTRDELVECAALVRAIGRGELDRLEIPDAPLDILAQQIVAACAAEDLGEDELFARVRRAYPYRSLRREDFDDVVRVLAEGVADRRGRRGALLHRDAVNRRLRGRRGARMTAITSGGAIPDVADYPVVAQPEGAVVGSVDEDFAVESMAGDVFLLGNTSWRIRRVESGRIHVENAHGAAPTIPFWRGEAPSRTFELSAEVSALREAIAQRADSVGKDQATAWLAAESHTPPLAAEQAVSYVLAGRAALGGALPTQRTVVAERFFDEAGGMQLVLHAPFGGRINRAWGLALRKRFCRSFNFELQAAATDDGLLLSLGEVHSFPLDLTFQLLRADAAEDVLTQAVLASPTFGARWRWNASRALALPRMRGGRRVPPPIQRVRAEELLAAIFPAQLACPENLSGGDVGIPDHPLVRQTLHDCLREAMDIDGLVRVLEEIEAGRIACVARDTAEASPLSHQIVNAMPYAFLDDAPLEERRARMVSLRRSLPESAEDLGALDAQAIAEVRSESWPDARDADELHDVLLTLMVLPERDGAAWGAHFERLVRDGRATRFDRGQVGSAWVAAERVAVARVLFPGAAIDPPIQALADGSRVDADDALRSVVRGRLDVAGPVTAEDLAGAVGVPADRVEEALRHLEAQGVVLRGRFTPGRPPDTVEWCERHVLARIHRRTLGRLRREIEPVAPADFVRFLLRWHHVAPGTQLHGPTGVRTVVAKLQGFELPAAAWERHVLAARIAHYDPAMLDQVCFSGEVAWGRLSLKTGDVDGTARGAGPTRAVPVSLVLRENLPWLLEPGNGPRERSRNAQAVVDHLARRGASFFGEIVAGTRLLAAAAEDGLAQSVASGLVTGDGFAALRSMVGGARARHAVGARNATGRWSLLRPAAEVSVQATGLVEKSARLLLARWGVVCRELCTRETRMPPWRELAVCLRQLEARGEIRGGRFIAGTTGAQFALPEAVESVRAVRRAKPTGERVRLSAADPLNLVGILTPGTRVLAIADHQVNYVDGVPESPAVARTGPPRARAVGEDD